MTQTDEGFAVLYRWHLHEGREEQFRDGWRRVTEAIHARCGSFGSRLHRAQDGAWVAYARWPSAQAREDCWDRGPLDEEGSRLMREAVRASDDEVVLTVLDDLLREPRP